MNSTATRLSAIRVARPITREPPLTSSDIVEIASKPRKDSTAIDSAPNTSDGENSAGLKNGVVDQWAPPAPPLMPITASTTNAASTSSCAYKKILLAAAVV